MKDRSYLTERRRIKSFYGYVNEDRDPASATPAPTQATPGLPESSVDVFFNALTTFASSGQTLQYLPNHIQYSKDVENVQAGLNYLGYQLPKFGIDGLLGPETSGALKKFQTDHQLQPSGNLDASTATTIASTLKGKDFDQSKFQSYIGDQNLQTKGQALLQDQDFVSKLKKISGDIGVQPVDLAKVMWAESRLNPAALEKKAGGSGLIGFMPNTAVGLGTTTFDLRKMSGIQQLDYVDKFYERFRGKLAGLDDLYLVTFYPGAMGKSPDFVIGSDRSDKYARLVAEQNPAISQGREYVTKQDFHNYVSRISQAFPHTSLLA